MHENVLLLFESSTASTASSCEVARNNLLAEADKLMSLNKQETPWS